MFRGYILIKLCAVVDVRLAMHVSFPNSEVRLNRIFTVQECDARMFNRINVAGYIKMMSNQR